MMPKYNPKRASLKVLRRNAAQEIAAPTLRSALASSSTPAKHRRTQEKYLDVLQNIEFAIVKCAKEWPALTGQDIATALQALEQAYSPSSPQLEDLMGTLPPPSAAIFDAVVQVCSIRSEVVDGRATPSRPMEDSLACILDSVQFWTQERGAWGYLNYVKQFFP